MYIYMYIYIFIYMYMTDMLTHCLCNYNMSSVSVILSACVISLNNPK